MPHRPRGAALIGVLAQVLRPVQHILLLLVLAVVVAFARARTETDPAHP